MNLKDRQKLLVAIIVLLVIVLVTAWRGEPDIYVKTAVIAGVVSWLVAMFVLNKEKKE